MKQATFPLWKCWICLTPRLPRPRSLSVENSGLRFFQGKPFYRQQSTEPFPDSPCSPENYQRPGPVKAVTSFMFKTLSLKQSPLVPARQWAHLQNDAAKWKNWAASPGICPRRPPWAQALGRGQPSLWRAPGPGGHPCRCRSRDSLEGLPTVSTPLLGNAQLLVPDFKK